MPRAIPTPTKLLVLSDKTKIEGERRSTMPWLLRTSNNMPYPCPLPSAFTASTHSRPCSEADPTLFHLASASARDISSTTSPAPLCQFGYPLRAMTPPSTRRRLSKGKHTPTTAFLSRRDGPRNESMQSVHMSSLVAHGTHKKKRSNVFNRRNSDRYKRNANGRRLCSPSF